MRFRLGHGAQADRVDVTGLEPAAAGTVHPAGDHVEHVTKPLRDRSAQVHRNPGASDHHRRPGGGEIPRHAFDLRARNIAAGGEIVEVGVGDEHAQFRYARGEFGAVLFVLEALVEDHLDHGQQQRPVLSGPHRQMHVGLLHGFGPQRVDDDDLRATLLPLERAPPSAGHRLQPIPCADSGIGADQQEVVAVVDVGHRRHHQRAVHRIGDDVPRVLVDRADGVPVVGADRVQPAVHEDDVGRREAGRIAVVEADRVRSIGVDQRVHSCGDIGDGLVPGRLDVGVAHPAHRVQDPAWMLDELVGGPALGAEVLPGVRVLLVGRDLRDAVSLDRDLDAARGEAVPAERVHGLGVHRGHLHIFSESDPVGPAIGIEQIA